MPDDTTATFPFPAIGRKKITAAFDGGRLSSDGGVMLLAQAERRLGIAERLARFIPDRRTPERVKHTIPGMLRARIFAIACGYEDCNDFGPLRAARPSSSPAGTCRRPGRISPRNRPSHAWRTLRQSGMRSA